MADFDADGTYDLVLSNHFHTRTRVYWGVPGTTRYTGDESLLPSAQDVHGITAGDLVRGEGGRKHILVTIGGTAGKGPPWDTNPRPPRLYEIRANRSWVDVTRRWGLSAARARGRSARLVDLTGSGRLDAVLFGSAVIVPWDKSPLQKVYLNSAGGEGRGRVFRHKVPSGVGSFPAEGVFMTDFNGDEVMDALAFSGNLGLFLGTGKGTFTDASAAWLADIPKRLWTGTPWWTPSTYVAALDYNSDGRPDLYVTVNGSRDLLLRNTGS